LIFAFGSRGDVQPYIPLGVALQQRGYKVTVLAGDEFEFFVKSYGLNFFPLGFKIRDTISEADKTQELLEGKKDLIRGIRDLLQEVKPAIYKMLGSCWDASIEADAVIFSTLGMTAYHVAEARNLPAIWALTMPAFSRTRAMPSPLFPQLPFREGGINLVTHILAEQAWHLLTGRFYNPWRREHLNLSPNSLFKWPYTQLHGKPLPKLYMFSSVVFPSPSDWGEDAHVTGYWFLDRKEDWKPPAGLVEFLAAGMPPIYIGFGSMAYNNPKETTEIVLAALEKSGQRGLLLSGWGGIGNQDLPESVFKIDSAPHDWLFPRMAAVAHHGGAGTVGAGLRSGVPSIVIPFAGDQPFWAWKVHQLGVGPKPIPRKSLTADRLADAIQEVGNNQAIRQRALEVGEKIRAEDGVAQAVAIIEQYLV
jgi:sterol 3beta-glucosyltransferase